MSSGGPQGVGYNGGHTMNSSNEPESEEVWEVGWEGHRQQQMERMAKLPLAEKLAWLEEAHRLVLQLQKSREASSRRDAGGSSE